MRGPQDALTAALKHPVDILNNFAGTVKGQKPVQLDSTFNPFFTIASSELQHSANPIPFCFLHVMVLINSLQPYCSTPASHISVYTQTRS
jgi:hypothetical protein